MLRRAGARKCRCVAGPDRIVEFWCRGVPSTRVIALTSFKAIRARAEKRKGGPKALDRLMPDKPDLKGLAKLGDDRALSVGDIRSEP